MSKNLRPLLLIGMMFFAGFSLVTVKLAIILGIIFFTSPVATHAVAQAAKLYVLVALDRLERDLSA